MAGANDGTVQAAAAAFEADLNAEQGVREPQAPRAESPRRQSPLQMEELFPQREVEGEARGGGDDDIPDVVKQARRQARKRDDEDDEPRVPRRQDDDEDDEDSRDLVDDEGDDEDLPAEEDEDEGGAEEAGLDLDLIVRVMADGEPVEVSLKEALDGYVRTKTFHKRLSQLQTAEQQLEAARGEIGQARNYYASMIVALKQQIAAFQPKEPDWDKLYAENPTEAARTERQWNAFRNNLAKLDQEQQRVAAEAAAEEQRRFNLWAQEQLRQMVIDQPDWGKNQKAWDRDRKSMRRTALAAGYSEQEVDELLDARAVRVLLKAAKFDRLMANKPRPVRQQQGSLRPGAITGRAAPNGVTRADRRLQKTGKLRDAARAFELDLDREG